MGDHRRRSLVIIMLAVMTLMICLGIIAALIALNAAVVRQFGSPVTGLSLTQRVMFPLELYFNQKVLSTPLDPAAEPMDFIVEQGESVSLICIRLEQEMLIEDAELLRIYLIYTGLDRQMKSGTFKLSAAMTPIQIAEEMLDATPTEVILSILPGWRIEEVAASVAGTGLAIPADVFTGAAYAPGPALFTYLPMESAPTLEGFLYPGTYVIPRAADLDRVLQTILTGFSENIDQDIMDGFNRQRITVYEAVILASIVEKEAVIDDEKPLIASVFYNRLGLGMRLETDPTVQYALGWQEHLQTWWKSPLSAADLGVDSPYNTYIIHGLPPTPICNPDVSSLRAVAFPAETPYLFFRAACDGSGRHNFAITYEEHLENGCE